MESTDVIQLVCYAISISVCAALAVYFLREFLNNKRLRASLWWATGFSLSAFGILVVSVTVYVLHEILMMLAFATVAASFAFLYYAASTLFFYRRSFFKEIFTVILFIASFVLFSLPEYLHQGERMAEIIRSPMIVLFVAAFLVLALVFNRVVKELHKRHYCTRVVALQSLTVWIIGVWSLYIASSRGSIIVAGLAFVLSLVGFILLSHSCRGGDHMKEEDKEFCIQIIDGVEYKVNRKIDAIRERLHDAMQEVGTALFYTMNAVDKTGKHLLHITGEVDRSSKHRFFTIEQVDEPGAYKPKDVAEAESNYNEEERKNKMVVNASTIGMKEDELVAHIVELLENVFRLARSTYEEGRKPRTGTRSEPRTGTRSELKTDGGNNTGTLDGVDGGVPLGSACGDAGQEASEMESVMSVKIEKLATLSFFKRSFDRDMIETCCELVIGICDMENNAVTKIEWKELSEDQHPRGMIGHTYNILRYYDEKRTEGKEYTYSQAFREEFQGKADEYLKKANVLRKCAFEYKVNLPPTPTEENANDAICYLEKAIKLLQDASDLVMEASTFPDNPPV